jgi:hypothetical protein
MDLISHSVKGGEQFMLVSVGARHAAQDNISVYKNLNLEHSVMAKKSDSLLDVIKTSSGIWEGQHFGHRTKGRLRRRKGRATPAQPRAA